MSCIKYVSFLTCVHLAGNLLSDCLNLDSTNMKDSIHVTVPVPYTRIDFAKIPVCTLYCALRKYISSQNR